MTTNIRRELCAVMLFAVVEHANIVVLNDGDQVRSTVQIFLNFSFIMTTCRCTVDQF